MVSSTLSSVSSTCLATTEVTTFQSYSGNPTLVRVHSSLAVSHAIVLPVHVDEPGLRRMVLWALGLSAVAARGV